MLPFHLVLDDVPVLGQFAMLKAHDIHHDPVRRQADAAKPTVKQHVVAIGDDKPILVTEVIGETFDHVEESLASGGNVRTVLNVIRRSETLRGDVIPLVEKRFKGVQHESLILFLDRLRHFVLPLTNRWAPSA